MVFAYLGQHELTVSERTNLTESNKITDEFISYDHFLVLDDIGAFLCFEKKNLYDNFVLISQSVPLFFTMMLSSAMEGIYAPPAVQLPITTAICAMPFADMFAWL